MQYVYSSLGLLNNDVYIRFYFQSKNINGSLTLGFPQNSLTGISFFPKLIEKSTFLTGPVHDPTAVMVTEDSFRSSLLRQTHCVQTKYGEVDASDMLVFNGNLKGMLKHK